MSYDRETADRRRECLATEADVSEKAMFDGLAFLTVTTAPAAGTSSA